MNFNKACDMVEQAINGRTMNRAIHRRDINRAIPYGVTVCKK